MTVSLFHLICLILGFSMEINQKMLHITSEGDHNCPGQAGISIFSLQKKRHGVGFGLSRFDQGGFLCEGVREVSHSVTWTPVKEQGERPACLADLRKHFRRSSPMTGYRQGSASPGKTNMKTCRYPWQLWRRKERLTGHLRDRGRVGLCFEAGTLPGLSHVYHMRLITQEQPTQGCCWSIHSGHWDLFKMSG